MEDQQGSLDGSSNRNTPKRCPRPRYTLDCKQDGKKIHRKRKAGDLRRVKVGVKSEIKEEVAWVGEEPQCKVEEISSAISADGSSNRNTPERCPRRPHSRDSTAEDHRIPQDHQVENLIDIKVEYMEGEVETYEMGEQQCKEEEGIPAGGSSNGNTAERCPRPLQSDCSKEDHRTPHDHQTESLGGGKCEATSQTECGEETCMTADQRVKEEDVPVDIATGCEANYSSGNNLYRSATTSKPVSHGADCDKTSKEYEQIIVGGKQFICTECGKSFSLYSYLTKHQRCHSGEKPYTCTVCGKCFTYKPSLVSHQRVHTGEKPFSCSECGKLFSSKFNLKTHEKIHSGDKPVVCPACGKCFSNNPALVKHLRIHTGEKPFSCSDCGKFFSSKSGLNAHLILHTGEKPFMCAECGKSFANQSNLISHRIIHTGEKPYVCSECGKGFANQSNLAKHKVIHTEEKPFLCMECGKFFTRKGSLDKHRERIHEKGKIVA